MSASDIELWVFSRADKSVSIEQRHAEIMARMAKIPPPLGFAGMDFPPAPNCGIELSASYWGKYPIRGLRFFGTYKYRAETYHYDDAAIFDDWLQIRFKISNKAIDYLTVLHEHLPKVIEAFQGYRAFSDYGPYLSAYRAGSPDGELAIDANGYFVQNNTAYNRLREDPSIDIDGRNNIYTLRPAQYWDAELCRRALGYGPDEVINRLQGQVPRVDRLMDGVYTVLNDDPALSYEDFVAMNEKIKPILGLL